MKALIFDMDGLMIDTERLYIETEREIAAQYGKTVFESTLWKMMGRKPIESIRIFCEETGIPVDPERMLEYRDGMMFEKMQNDLQALPGLYEILERFSGRLKMAIGTGAKQKFLDFAVDKLQVRKYFAHLQPSDNIRLGKPEPEIYVKTAEALEIEPAQCVVLEDSANGILAAKRAGCYAIAVPSEYTEKQDFSSADKTVKDLFEASEWIECLLGRV